MKKIMVKDLLGANPSVEDAIILKQIINSNLDESVVLDFTDVQDITCPFFANLLTDMFYKRGREKVIKNLQVKNLKNEKDFRRIVLGTSYC